MAGAANARTVFRCKVHHGNHMEDQLQEKAVESEGRMRMVETRRIVSFLPSATEMICALGLGERLLGVTHECDYPPEIAGKPIVVRNVLPIESMSQSEIDRAVTQRLRDGLSLYRVDEA